MALEQQARSCSSAGGRSDRSYRHRSQDMQRGAADATFGCGVVRISRRGSAERSDSEMTACNAMRCSAHPCSLCSFAFVARWRCCCCAEYPDVLASILGALKAIVNVMGMSSMTPPIKDLLPRLTPILRNRHERVQEVRQHKHASAFTRRNESTNQQRLILLWHCLCFAVQNTIDLVGRIADRGAEFVSAKEWMRIWSEFPHTHGVQMLSPLLRASTADFCSVLSLAVCVRVLSFELLEMLKAHKKGIRRATVNTVRTHAH